jgi:hypothetical protein
MAPRTAAGSPPSAWRIQLGKHGDGGGFGLSERPHGAASRFGGYNAPLVYEYSSIIKGDVGNAILEIKEASSSSSTFPAMSFLPIISLL